MEIVTEATKLSEWVLEKAIQRSHQSIWLFSQVLSQASATEAGLL